MPGARNRRGHRQGGLTLIELVMFIIIIGVAVAGVLLTFNTTVFVSADPLVSRQLQAVAEAMLEEVLLQNYENPPGSPDPGGNRALFDNVDDYDGYGTDINGLRIAGITTPNGEQVPGLGDYSVVVRVSGVLNWNGATARLITVIASRGRDSFTLSGYRTQDPPP